MKSCPIILFALPSQARETLCACFFHTVSLFSCFKMSCWNRSEGESTLPNAGALALLQRSSHQSAKHSSAEASSETAAVTAGGIKEEEQPMQKHHSVRKSGRKRSWVVIRAGGLQGVQGRKSVTAYTNEEIYVHLTKNYTEIHTILS